jgi:hypothetical protein
MSTSKYASVPRIHSSRSINKLRHRLAQPQYTEEITMKLTFKQRLRNWLMNDGDDYGTTITIDEGGPDLQSQGFRLNIYGASGGTIIETTKYDRKQDENRHSLHVVTDDKDLGEALSKIITMEQLR